MDEHKSKFTQNFADNKKALEQITIIRSKGLKNEIAGYITKYIKHEIRDHEIKHAQQDTIPQDENTDVSAATVPETLPSESIGSVTAQPDSD